MFLSQIKPSAVKRPKSNYLASDRTEETYIFHVWYGSWDGQKSHARSTKTAGISWSAAAGHSGLNGLHTADDSFNSGSSCVIVNKMNLKY